MKFVGVKVESFVEKTQRKVNCIKKLINRIILINGLQKYKILEGFEMLYCFLRDTLLRER